MPEHDRVPFNGDPLAFLGKLLIEEQHRLLLKKFPKINSTVHTISRNFFKLAREIRPDPDAPRVGILGAGIGGLYAALILDSLGISYEILEASDRAGGRLQTYRFQNKGEYDYYDAGAMRFPLPKKDKNGKYKNGVHWRLAHLIEYEKLNETDPLKDKLIPYYHTASREGSEPGFYYFNGVRERVREGVRKGSFNGEEMGVSSAYIRAGADAIHKDVIGPFVRVLADDMWSNKLSGWATLLQNDIYSVRGYMSSKYLPSNNLGLPPKHLPNDVIDWTSLLESANGAYDRSLTEAVFSEFSAATVGDRNFGDVDWRCFKGGSETLPKKIVDYLKSKGTSIQYNKRVTAISHAIESHAGQGLGVTYPVVRVEINGSEHKNYLHVISTLPLTVLRTVNLKDAGLSTLQKNALRSLDYGPAIKIAILFKSNWWTTKLGIVGGQSFTDLPISTVVYPSYGVDSRTPSKVLIASYARASDAYRLSALSTNKEELKKLVLHNLVEVHNSKEITYDYLLGECEDLHVKDWNSDEFAMGAFAFFSPGDYGRSYALLNLPGAHDQLHFAGEALSIRHGWVVGALDSSWKAVYQYLKITGQKDELAKFEEIWGTNWEWKSKSTIPGQEGNEVYEEHIAFNHAADAEASG